MSDIIDCPVKEAHELRLNKNEKEIEELYDKVNKIDKDTSIALSSIVTSLESLSKLPDAIEKLNTSMIKMECTIDNSSKETKDLSNKVDNLSDKVDSQIKEIKIDVESKVAKVKEDQKGLETKITEVSIAPALKTQTRFDKLKDNAWWVVVGGILTWIVSQLLELIK